MSYRRALIVVVLLALAGLACSLGPSVTSVPPTSAPPAASKTPVNFHNGGVTPEEGSTEQPSEEPTSEEQPTKAPTKADARPKAAKAAPARPAPKSARPKGKG